MDSKTRNAMAFALANLQTSDELVDKIEEAIKEYRANPCDKTEVRVCEAASILQLKIVSKHVGADKAYDRLNSIHAINQALEKEKNN